MNLLPFLDAGVIVIIFTIIVKLILLPLSIKASKAQIQMKSAESDLQLIKEKHKDNKEEIGKKTMEYYKEKGINPFSSLLILLIQIPILIGLYRIFIVSGLPQINTDLLYSFITAPKPEDINMLFLGLIDLSGKSIFLALVAGITTYFQVVSANPPVSGNSSQNDFAKAMSVQMKYALPVLMAFVAYTVSSAIALYLITSNVFATAQEIYIRKKYHKNVSVI